MLDIYLMIHDWYFFIFSIYNTIVFEWIILAFCTTWKRLLFVQIYLVCFFYTFVVLFYSSLIIFVSLTYLLHYSSFLPWYWCHYIILLFYSFIKMLISSMTKKASNAHVYTHFLTWTSYWPWHVHFSKCWMI